MISNVTNVGGVSEPNSEAYGEVAFDFIGAIRCRRRLFTLGGEGGSWTDGLSAATDRRLKVGL